MSNPAQKQHEQSLLNAHHAGGLSTVVGEQSTTINVSHSKKAHEDNERMPLSANTDGAADVITIEEAQQLVWELPKIDKQNKASCIIHMQSPPIPNPEKQMAVGSALVAWIILVIISIATHTNPLLYVSFIFPVIIVVVCIRCDGPRTCRTTTGVNYEQLPQECKNYHFDQLFGIIDVKSKLFYVYEIGVDKTIKNTKERNLKKYKIYHQKIVLKLNDVVNVECPGVRRYRRGLYYSSSSEDFKLILKYKSDIPLENVNNVNNIGQMILNRYSVTKLEADVFLRWFRREYEIHGPKLHVVSEDYLVRLGRNVNRNAGVEHRLQQEAGSNRTNTVNAGQDVSELKKLVRSFILSDNQDISTQGNELDYFILKYETQMVKEYVELRKEYMQNNASRVDEMRKLLIVKGRNIDKLSKNQHLSQV